MSERFSVYLDLVRFLAAMIVLLSHFAYPRFTDGDYILIREFNLGSDAVVVFFVLSGFIISHCAQDRCPGARKYFFDRFTRLLSVAIPALALTYVLDQIGRTGFPEVYADWWFNPLPLWEFMVKGMTFSNEWAGLETRLGTNGPYWSLSYEAAYYILFGIMVFTVGFRRVALVVLCCAVFGINILLLAPCWMLGVFVHRISQRPLRIANSLCFVLAVAPLIVYALFLAIGTPARLTDFTIMLIGEDAYAALRFSNEFAWSTAIAFLFAVHMLGCLHLMRGKAWKGSVSQSIRWSAGATFSIYLVHYPVMQFVHGAFPGSGHKVIDHAALLFITLITCFVFASLFERRLGEFRQMVRTRFSLRAVGHIQLFRS